MSRHRSHTSPIYLAERWGISLSAVYRLLKLNLNDEALAIMVNQSKLATKVRRDNKALNA